MSNAATHDEDDLPRPPQFGLRTMFYGVAACAGCVAVVKLLGPVYGTIFAWFVLLVIAHVVANVWGTRLKSGRTESPRPNAGSPAGELAFAPSTSLSHRLAIGKLMIGCAGMGAAIGCGLGSYLLTVANGSKLGIAGLVLGGGSSAVIGGFLGFLASSFLEVSHKAWRHGWDRWQEDLPKAARRPSWLSKLAGILSSDR